MMIAKKLVEIAMRKADGAQASYSQSESSDVSFENDRLKYSKSSQSTDLVVKVILDGKIGTSYSTDKDDLEGVVDRAVAAAEIGSPAHFEFPGPRKGRKVKTFDKAVLAVTRTEMVAMCKEMLDLIKEYNSEILVGADAGRSRSETEFANSAGVEHTVEQTGFGLDVGGELVRGTDMLHAGHSRTWRKLDHDPKAVAGKAIEWFRMAEKTASVRSCEMPVIFVPQAMKILLIALNLGWNGKNVFLKTSPLAGKLGRRIADERLSITDNPLVDFAGVSGSRDGEGVPHRVTPLIEKGVLKTFLYDLDTAGRAGTESTGHGPGCGTTNLVIAPGDTSFEEMVKSTKEGLLVRSVLGLGQGNTISGEFSVNLHLGYKIENGEIVGRVKNAMLAGNTYDALRQIDSIGNQPEWVGDSLYTPPFKIEKLSVVAS